MPLPFTKSSRVVDFLRELREIVRAALLIDTGADTGGSAAAAPGAAGTLGTTTTSAAAAAAASTNASHADFYPMLVAELERVGWAHVLEISADLRRLVFGLHDERQVGVPQLHRLQVQLRSGYPLTAPTVSSSLPRPFALRWSANGSSLAQLVAQFREAVRQCLPIWEALATVDQATWVLDPKNPGPAALDRRIALGGNCSLQLLLDPLRPRALPQIRFLGPDHRTQPLKTAFNKNAHTWSEDASLFDNLARCVGVSFPQPTEEDAVRFEREGLVIIMMDVHWQVTFNIATPGAIHRMRHLLLVSSGRGHSRPGLRQCALRQALPPGVPL